MKKIILVLIIFLSGIELHAQSLITSLIEISKITEDSRRLAAYDMLVNSLDDKSQSNNVENWIMSESIDLMDDSRIFTASNTAKQGTNTFGDNPTLMIRCKSKQTDLYIIWDNFLGSEKIEIEYRFGSNESMKSEWNISTDGTAAFLGSTAVTGFLNYMKNYERFIVRLSPYNESPSTAVFDISGIDEVLSRLYPC